MNTAPGPRITDDITADPEIVRRLALPRLTRLRDEADDASRRAEAAMLPVTAIDENGVTALLNRIITAVRDGHFDTDTLGGGAR